MENIFQVNQELSVRLKKAVKSAKILMNWSNKFIPNVYTKARVRRLLTYILLNIPKQFDLPEQIHVLGFSKTGQEILAQIGEKLSVKLGKTHGTT